MLEPAHARECLVERLGATRAPAFEWDALLGGKGSSLERLRRLGAPTPPGFCLTTLAFRHQLEHGTGGRAAPAVGRLPDEGARATLVSLLTDARLAPALAGELDAAMHDLAQEAGVDARYAVRSSALGEDSSAASFAGIHETVLGVTASEVPAAIGRCWASLWSERAMQYRGTRGMPTDGAMAVVVQVLVPADVSAVVFTRHPVTRRDDQILVNAARGLGEALVSGLVTPDEAVVDKPTLRPLSLVPVDGEAVVTDAELVELAGIAVWLEREFDRPLDIEAALAAGRWHVLQARPITA